MPTVRELHIESQLTPLTAPWHKILPNLNTLHFRVSSDFEHYEQNANNLAFLLRHFPRITELKLMLGVYGRMKQDFWDVLTGGAPRPLSTHDLLHASFGGQMHEQEETRDEICRTASLHNLYCKQFFLNALIASTITRLY